MNFNQTFIIEPQSITGGTPVISACTTIYTNVIHSCSGDTSLSLGTGVSTINSNLLISGNISGTTVYTNNTNLNSLLQQKINTVQASGFTGTPQKAIIVFTTNFSNVNYSVLITGGDSRNFTYESQTISGFTINTNANGVLTQPVNWFASQPGEFK